MRRFAYVVLTALLILPVSTFAQRKGLLTNPQKQAALDALKELRKLASAVEIGLTFSQYSDRVIDAKVEIDQRLRGLRGQVY